MRLTIQSEIPEIDTEERSVKDGYFDGLGQQLFEVDHDYDAVFTFWTRPYKNRSRGYGGFLTQKDFLTSWGLSVSLARRYFRRVKLVTDSAMKEIFPLPLMRMFDSISYELDSISDNVPSGLWAYGKLKAYAAQHKPFIHLDNDVFLWNGLPKRLQYQNVVIQNIERTEWAKKYYRLGVDLIHDHIDADVFLPEGGYNVGIFGGDDLSLIHGYAYRIMDLVDKAADAKQWFSINPNHMTPCMVALEQGGLMAQCLRESITPVSMLNDMDLFSSDSIRERETREAHYTHLCGYRAKRDPANMENMQHALSRVNPCLNF